MDKYVYRDTHAHIFFFVDNNNVNIVGESYPYFFVFNQSINDDDDDDYQSGRHGNFFFVYHSLLRNFISSTSMMMMLLMMTSTITIQDFFFVFFFSNFKIQSCLHLYDPKTKNFYFRFHLFDIHLFTHCLFYTRTQQSAHVVFIFLFKVLINLYLPSNGAIFSTKKNKKKIQPFPFNFSSLKLI